MLQFAVMTIISAARLVCALHLKVKAMLVNLWLSQDAIDGSFIHFIHFIYFDSLKVGDYKLIYGNL